MNKSETIKKDQYESPSVTDIKPVSIVEGQDGSGPEEGDSDWE